MTNKEKYYDELMDYALAGVAIDKNTNKIVSCKGFKCVDCKFNQYPDVECDSSKLIWLNEEYIEPETDWSKVEVDTPILVRNTEWQTWRVRHFAKYEDGKVWGWNDGRTSYTSLWIDPIDSWDFAQLLTPKELEQRRRKV